MLRCRMRPQLAHSRRVIAISQPGKLRVVAQLIQVSVHVQEDLLAQIFRFLQHAH